MIAQAHTPGPWKASQTYPLGDWCIHAPSSPWQLAYVAKHSQVEWPLEANARLIAAAPDMLAALYEILSHDPAKDGHYSSDCLEQCRAIARITIAKAEGRS